MILPVLYYSTHCARTEQQGLNQIVIRRASPSMETENNTCLWSNKKSVSWTYRVKELATVGATESLHCFSCRCDLHPASTWIFDGWCVFVCFVGVHCHILLYYRTTNLRKHAGNCYFIVLQYCNPVQCMDIYICLRASSPDALFWDFSVSRDKNVQKTSITGWASFSVLRR